MMNRFRTLVSILFVLAGGVVGCHYGREDFRFPAHQTESGPYQSYATQVEYPDVATVLDDELASSGPPRATDNPRDQKVRNLTLSEAVRMALSHGEILRNLGGTVVSSPAGTRTMFDPALVESDPRASVEAALSAFDAQFSSSLFWNKIDRGINQTFSGLFLPVAQQLQSNYVAELSKTTATGAKFAVRHHIDYNRALIANPSLRFPSVWQLDYEAEYRQPLLQGAGVQFNRIAGPNSSAGAMNGVLLARIDSDISLADFESGVIQLISDVEDAYWDLYFGYRDLEAMIAGRDSALVTWRNIAERLRIGLRGGTPENEAQLRSQYFSFQAAVENATSTLYAREGHLRYLLGLPPNGPELLRPATEPTTAKIIFDWQQILNEACLRRVELRREKWRVKRTELELVAARNFIKPRLDAVALYRWRGIGDDWIHAGRGATGFESAYQNLTSGRFQEWQLGVQLNMPIGFRREFTALRNAELRLARERAILKEQEFRISHDLSDALRGMERAFQLMKTNLNRRVAAAREVDALRARFDVGFEELDVLLQAEKRLADADSAYYRAQVDYVLAVKDVHRAKGTLLQYDQVTLTEGPWLSDAYRDALERSRHFAPRLLDYGIARPVPLSRGAYSWDELPDLPQVHIGAPTPAELESIDTPTAEPAAAGNNP